jgi:outer membrane protein assembly factor BamB
VLGVSDLVLWTGASRSDASADRQLLIASSGTSGLWALDPETGEQIWRRSLPSGGVSAPVAISGALMVSTTRLGVFLISPLGGDLMDGIHMADGSAMTPAAEGTRAFLLTNAGTLLALRVTPPLADFPANRAPL